MEYQYISQYITKKRPFCSTFHSTFAIPVQAVQISTNKYEWPPCYDLVTNWIGLKQTKDQRLLDHDDNQGAPSGFQRGTRYIQILSTHTFGLEGLCQYILMKRLPRMASGQLYAAVASLGCENSIRAHCGSFW